MQQPVSESSPGARYILALAADPNWPDETSVPRPAALEHEVAERLGVPTVLRAQCRAFNPGADAARFYDLKVNWAVTPSAVTDAVVQTLGRQRDHAFFGVPVRVILYTQTGSVASRGTAHPGPR